MIKHKCRWMAAPLLALTTMATLATASIPVIQSYTSPVMAQAAEKKSDAENKQYQKEQASKSYWKGVGDKAAAYGQSALGGAASIIGDKKDAKNLTKASNKTYEQGTKEMNNESSNGGDSGQGGNYKSLQPPSMLSTALYDGLGIASSAADNGKDNAYTNFDANIKTIMGVQNDMGHTLFSNTGAMYGAIGLSNNSATSNVIQKQAADTTFLKKKFGQQGLNYYHFGLALTDLETRGAKSQASNMSTKSFVDGFNGLAASVSIMGLSILQKINPFPVVLTMMDSNVRKDPKYASGSNKNLFIGFINDHAMFYGITDFFGKHIGNTSLTIANMIIVVIMLISLGLAALTTVLNGRQWGITVRKFMSKVFIFSVGIPIASLIFTFGLNTLKNVVSGKQTRSEASIIRDNLDLGDWAKAAKFGLPAGMNLKIESGQFVLDEDTIQKINLYTMYKSGVIGSYSPTKANIKAATKYIQQRASQSDNRTTINWQDTTRVSDGNPYSTSGLIQVANALGTNQKISLSKNDMNNIAYLSYASLNTTDGKTFHMDGSKQSSDFGLTPLSAYNILNTNFDKNGLSVNSNINSPQIATVAVGANNYSSASLAAMGGKPSGVLLFFLNIVMMSAAFGALARIFTAGFGGVLHGGGSTTFGTATGWGELIGGAIALTFGVIGLSLVITAVQYSFETIFSVIVGAVNKAISGNPLIKILSGWRDTLNGIPIFGTFLADIMQGVVNLIITVVMLIMAPKFIKIPINAYGNWIEGLPGVMAEKVQEIENRFTGDYRAGGRVGANIKNSMDRQFAENKQKHDQKSRERRDALRTAAGMLLGAGAASVFGFGKKNDDSVKAKPGEGGNGDNPTTKEPKPTEPTEPSTEPGTGVSGPTTNNTGGDIKSDSINNESTSKNGDTDSINQMSSEDSMADEGKINDNIDNVDGNEIGGNSLEQAEMVAESVGADDSVAAPQDVDNPESVSEGKEPHGNTNVNGDQSVSQTENVNGDAVSSEDSVNQAEEQGNPDSQTTGNQSVTNENNNVDKSNAIDRDVDSSQSVNGDKSVSQTGGNIEGNSVDNQNIDTDAKNNIDANSTLMNAEDARNVNNGQSVNQQGNLNKNSVNNGRSTDNTTNVGQNQSVNNETKTEAKSNGKDDHKEALKSSTKANNLGVKAKGIAGAIKNAGPTSTSAKGGVKSVIGNITRQSHGEVGNKERVSMAVAHAAAAMVGAQGLTQGGINHIKNRDIGSVGKALGKRNMNQSVNSTNQIGNTPDVKTGGLKDNSSPLPAPTTGSGTKTGKQGKSFFTSVKGFNNDPKPDK